MPAFTTGEKYISLPLSFVNGPMAKAHGEYVKVYLYGLAAALQGLESDNETIAQTLKILVTDVENAWKYWEEQGLLSVTDGGITFGPDEKNEKKEKAPDELPQVTPSDIAAAIKLDPGMKDTIDAIEKLMGKPLTRREISSIYNFMEWYGMDKDVVVMLFEYCVSMEKKGFSYIEKVAQNWSENGINDVKSAEAVIKRANAEKKFQSQCRRLFGLDRSFTPSEIKYINSWKSDMNFSMNMISRAYEITVKNTGKLAFPYMNKVLASWNQKGIKTPEKIQELDKKFSQGTKIDDIELMALRRRMNLDNR